MKMVHVKSESRLNKTASTRIFPLGKEVVEAGALLGIATG